jgi:hypothetical protein
MTIFILSKPDNLTVLTIVPFLIHFSKLFELFILYTINIYEKDDKGKYLRVQYGALYLKNGAKIG